jgi:hypothetical protein
MDFLGGSGDFLCVLLVGAALFAMKAGSETAGRREGRLYELFDYSEEFGASYHEGMGISPCFRAYDEGRIWLHGWYTISSPRASLFLLLPFIIDINFLTSHSHSSYPQRKTSVRTLNRPQRNWDRGIDFTGEP